MYLLQHPSFCILALLVLFLIPSTLLRNTLKLAVPLVAVAVVFSIQPEQFLTYQIGSFDIEFLKADQINLVFCKLFSVIALCISIYMYAYAQVREYVAAFSYLAAALGTVLAGDWLTFIVLWESLTIGAVLLILNGQQTNSRIAAIRYAFTHIIGGLFMLAGIVLLNMSSESLRISTLELNNLPSYLIFIGMGFNAAFPLLHFWVVDAYPEASAGGTVLLAALTTKTAIYAFLRCFPGTELLVFVGVLMAVFPLIFAFVEQDYRRALAYCLLNPLGFMLIGIGFGTETALQGTLAFVVSHVIYKSLLFMAAGYILLSTGDLVFERDKKYQLTYGHLLLLLFGSLAMVMPGFPGFVSKVLLLGEIKKLGHGSLYYILFISSLLIFWIACLKPIKHFFAKNLIASVSMHWGIAIGSLSIFVVAMCLGCCPESFFFSLLPGSIELDVNSVAAISTQIGYLFVTIVIFYFCRNFNLYLDTRNFDIQRIWYSLMGVLYSIFSYLNQLNQVFHNVFVKGLPASLYSILPNVSNSLLQAIFVPYWSLEGDTGSVLREKQALLKAENEEGFFPIGWTIIAALVVFIFLFALYRVA